MVAPPGENVVQMFIRRAVVMPRSNVRAVATRCSSAQVLALTRTYTMATLYSSKAVMLLLDAGRTDFRV